MYTHMPTCAYTYKCIQAYLHMHTYICTNTHVQTWIHTHTHKYTQSQMRKYTNTPWNYSCWGNQLCNGSQCNIAMWILLCLTSFSSLWFNDKCTHTYICIYIYIYIYIYYKHTYTHTYIHMQKIRQLMTCIRTHNPLHDCVWLQRTALMINSPCYASALTFFSVYTHNKHGFMALK